MTRPTCTHFEIRPSQPGAGLEPWSLYDRGRFCCSGSDLHQLSQLVEDMEQHRRDAAQLAQYWNKSGRMCQLRTKAGHVLEIEDGDGYRYTPGGPDQPVKQRWPGFGNWRTF